MDEACVVGGLGVVGGATAKVFGIKKIFDLKGSTITLEQAAKCKFVFICLPTPVDNEGNYVTSDIEAIIKQLEGYGGAGIYILRSTVWPGFAGHLMDSLGINRIISNPEFLTQATAEKDSKNPPFILLGGAVPTFLQEVKGLYEGRIKGALVILTDNTTAELAKLALNGFFSTKVIYANQIYDVARASGANYEIIRKVFDSHPFGFRNHSEVIFRGKRGIHGGCLPKDLRALGRYTSSPLVQKVLELNEEVKNKTE